ncbi:MAG: phage antirepressor protein, partial [Clostridia bacterium]|nr:phage antirepressor protein [Clostridia bacterium]
NDMTKAWSGKTVREYKELKGLRKENLRDNMTDIELALNSLAEVTTRALTAQRNPQGLEENRQVAKSGGGVSKTARLEIERELGKSVISPLNAGDKDKLITRQSEEVFPTSGENEE